jgi:hypothetical protein
MKSRRPSMTNHDEPLIDEQLGLLQLEQIARALAPQVDLRKILRFVQRAAQGQETPEAIRRARKRLESYIARHNHLPTPEVGIARNAKTVFVQGALKILDRALDSSVERYMYYPPLTDVEVLPEKEGEELRRGALRSGYGTSMYEFHYEYPVEGGGARKDRILVVLPDGRRQPIFDYCRERRIVVYCNRCGGDITYEVSIDCPARHER